MPTLLENMKPHIDKMPADERARLIAYIEEQIAEKLQVEPGAELPEALQAGLAELHEAKAYLEATLAAKN